MYQHPPVEDNKIVDIPCMECSRGRRDSDSGTVDQPTMTVSREMLGTMSEEKLF